MLSLAICLTLALLTTIKSYAEAGSSPGIACQPANLSQTLALGLGWCQFVLTNNSLIGGGSFFTVCPVHVENELHHNPDKGGFNSYLPTTVNIDVAYLDAAAKDITCTLLMTNTEGTGQFPVVLIAEDMNVPANPGQPQESGEGFGFIDRSANGFNPRYNALSIICAMHPQTRIGQINTYWEDLTTSSSK